MRTKIQPYIADRLISEQKHPETDLWIYNYTHACQYNRKWDEMTMMCRGLILDKEGNIIARPFRKFFNMEEHLQEKKELPNEDFEVYEKLDGSLGILYFIGNEPRLATRGSFTSEQALKGTEILHRRYKAYPFDRKLTYLFEIIYPENRIVIDYKGAEEVVLLAVIETAAGKELPLDQFTDFKTAKRYDGITDFKLLKEQQEDNREGYVIRFQSGLRLKLKFDEYVRLHRLVTETNAKRIWEYLKDDKPIQELLERVPDEFYAWVQLTIAKLQEAFKQVEEIAKKDFDKLEGVSTRKEFASKVATKQTRSILFRMLDGRDYSEAIWKMVKPRAEKPFKEEI